MAGRGTRLAESFDRYFSVELALTPAQKREVFEIRYNVYCEELGYESSDRFPDKQEYDDYDENSLHCLIRHRATGRAASCVRIVLGNSSNYSAKFPIENYCAEHLEPEVGQLLSAFRSSSCEISRLAVGSSFRQRSGEQRSQIGGCAGMDLGAEERRSFSMLAEVTSLASIAMAKVAGCEHLFAMMEPFLPRLLRRSGIYFHQAGDELEFRGLRAPYLASMSCVEENLRSSLRPLFYSIYDQFEESLSEKREYA